MARTVIPFSIIGVLSRVLDEQYSRGAIVALMMEAGAVGDDPYVSSKKQMIQDWLKTTNRSHPDPLAVLGALIKQFLLGQARNPDKLGADLGDIEAKLGAEGLHYADGLVTSTMGSATVKTLHQLLQQNNFPAVQDEFRRATASLDMEPREAVSAAANILEAICKEYIVQHPDLVMPSKQDLSAVFAVVRRDLGFDPSAIEDDDLKRVLGGVFTIVDGIGALRTHASSAHQQATSLRQYRLLPRHARLAVSAAHTVVTFIIETWQQRRS